MNITDDYGKLDWDYLCENTGAIPILEEYINQEEDRKYQSHLDISDVPYFSKINIERLGYNKGDLTNILKNQNILDFYTDLSYEFIVENKQILEKQIEHISKSVNINFNIERKFIKYNETQQLIKNKLENIKTSLQRNIYIIDIFNNLENTLTKKYFFDTIFNDDLITTITVNPVILKLFIPDSLVKIECIKIFISLLKNKKLKSNEKIKKIFKYIPDVFTEISDYKFTQHIFKLKNIIDDTTID